MKEVVITDTVYVASSSMSHYRKPAFRCNPVDTRYCVICLR